MDRHILLTAEDALVDLRRKIARDFHRQRSEKLIRGFKLAVHAPDRRGLAPLQADEGRPAGRHERKIAQQIFEGKNVAGGRLGDDHLLNAANVADLPVMLRAFRMGIMAIHASGTHDDRHDQAHPI